MNKRQFMQMLGLSLALPAGLGLAQTPRVRDVRVIVPLPAGSSNDFVTRVLMPLVSEITGQNYVIDNKPGGSGTIGMQDLVRAAPDGATLLCGSLSPLALNVAFFKNLGYDPRTDVTPIAATSMTNHVVLVRADSPIRSFEDLLAHARKRPGALNVGYSTAMVQTQIATINRMAGIELFPIPYRGTPATIVDVISGVLDVTFTDPGNALAQIAAGHLRALAVSALQRNPLTPDWPAISETLPGFDFSSWNALVGPRDMPRDLVTHLSDAVIQAQKQPSLIESYAKSGTVPLSMGPDALKDYMVAETERYIHLAREAGIEPI